MITKNGDKPKFPIEGTNLLTDDDGLKAIKQVSEQYVNKQPVSKFREMSGILTGIFHALRSEGRLFRKDGTIV